MTPKVDTLNFAYFVPGVVLLSVIPFVLDCVVPAKTALFLNTSTTIVNSAVFLAFAYVAGYTMWVLAGIPSRLLFDHVFCQLIFYYVCKKPLKKHYVSMLKKGGYRRVAAVVEKPKSFKWCKWREWNEITLKEGRALHMFIWDELYNRENPYHIGRYLSDWNNLKFAKATLCSFVVGAVVFALMLLLLWGFDIGNNEAGFPLVLGFTMYAAAGVIYIPVTLWRIDVCARDLAHGLCPSVGEVSKEAPGENTVLDEDEDRKSE